MPPKTSLPSFVRTLRSAHFTSRTIKEIWHLQQHSQNQSQGGTGRRGQRVVVRVLREVFTFSQYPSLFLLGVLIIRQRKRILSNARTPDQETHNQFIESTKRRRSRRFFGSSLPISSLPIACQEPGSSFPGILLEAGHQGVL